MTGRCGSWCTPHEVAGRARRRGRIAPPAIAFRPSSAASTVVAPAPLTSSPSRLPRRGARRDGRAARSGWRGEGEHLGERRRWWTAVRLPARPSASPHRLPPPGAASCLPASLHHCAPCVGRRWQQRGQRVGRKWKRKERKRRRGERGRRGETG